MATNGEFALGAGRPYASLLGVMWGTGVGGGLILNGEPWLGRGGAGEIGHMVVRINGRRCPCGRRGCMEAYAGRAAMEARARKKHEKGMPTDLFKLMRERGRTKLTSSVWARALENEDKLAIELIDEAVEALGAGVASAQNLLDVEAIVIGGGLGVRLGEPFVERIRTAMGPHLFNDKHPPDVLLAGLGDLGGALARRCWSANGRRRRPAPELGRRVAPKRTRPCLRAANRGGDRRTRVQPRLAARPGAPTREQGARNSSTAAELQRIPPE